MLAIVTFVIVLGTLIFVHELGHFVVAKLANVKVLEFGFGYPPRLFGIRRGETLYSVNLLPLGGFVKLLGEEDPSQPRSLASKPAWVRLCILMAGSSMNILLPLVLFTIIFMVPQTTLVGQVTIHEVAPESPAAMAGILPGDVVTAVNDRPVENNGDLSYLLQLNLGRETTWTIHRFGVTETVAMVPRLKPPKGQGATGVVIETIDPREERRSLSLLEAIPRSAGRVVEVLIISKNEIARWMVGASSPQIAGPIGIAQLTGEVARVGLAPLVLFTALLSINLAILNMLPIPMLDGGRVMFVILEIARRGKRISPQKEGFVHMVGFMLLLSLIAVISYFDILRIIRGESIIR